MCAYQRSSITVDNSSFDKNVAGTNGGVIIADQRSNITVVNSSFANNEAGNDGGVMSACTGSSSIITVHVSNSPFDNNKAGYGGVMYAYSSATILFAHFSIIQHSKEEW